MHWDGQSVIGLAVLIVGQAGVLVWKLSSISTKLNSMCTKQNTISEDVGDIEHRLTHMETKCDMNHPPIPPPR